MPPSTKPKRVIELIFFGSHVSLSYLLDVDQLDERGEYADNASIDSNFLNEALKKAVEASFEGGVKFAIEDVRFKGGASHNVYEFIIACPFLESLLESFCASISIKTPPYLHLAVATNMKSVNAEKSSTLRKKINKILLNDGWQDAFKNMTWCLVVYDRWACPESGKQGGPIQIRTAPSWILSESGVSCTFL